MAGRLTGIKSVLVWSDDTWLGIWLTGPAISGLNWGFSFLGVKVCHQAVGSVLIRTVWVQLPIEWHGTKQFFNWRIKWIYSGHVDIFNDMSDWLE